jgi:tetratricopeptide (TPR) repeat protein
MKHKKTNIQNQPLQNRSGSSSLKRRVFWIITILIPLVLLGTAEIGLRIFHYGDTIPLFVSIPDTSSKYYGMNLDIAKRYFTKLSDIPTPRKDLFLKEKPSNGYRIFILGESTAAGFPYGNNITFSRILNRRLSDTFPDKNIEVVNTALAAINTYAQVDFMNEILEQKPDAILIYTGHNEYYGALGVGSMESAGKYRWIVKASLVLQKLRIYQFTRNSIAAIVHQFDGKSSIEKNTDPSATLMERIVEKKIISIGSDDYFAGIHQFKDNLTEIIRKAKEAGVKVLLSELVSNIHDNEPFESIDDGKHPPAMKVYREAREYEKRGMYDDARKAFTEAKDLDALRFRAPEEINIIIHTVAEEYNIPVVPMKAYFESRSPHGIIGDQLLHEHVHFNIRGYFLAANAFFETMKKERFIDASWNDSYIKSSDYYQSRWGVTTLDTVYASDIIMRLKSRWPFTKVQNSVLTLASFKPITIIDSLAASIILSGAQTLEQGHMVLANYYESRGELEKAFDEYHALIYIVPYFDLFYEPAVKVLVEMKKYNEALEVLQELLKYQQTSFVYQWIGQIYLINHELSKGIVYLEKARQNDPRNSVLLYNLGRAYFNTSQFEKGNEIIGQLKQSSSDLSFISKLEAYKKSLLIN